MLAENEIKNKTPRTKQPLGNQAKYKEQVRWKTITTRFSSFSCFGVEIYLFFLLLICCSHFSPISTAFTVRLVNNSTLKTEESNLAIAQHAIKEKSECILSLLPLANNHFLCPFSFLFFFFSLSLKYISISQCFYISFLLLST